ncbi:MAG TPA: MarR family transcriptional regulator [Candidatus Krumholzibacteria bacterium]|nr:MarR family transcriptional regulator [Candidatus Krumholzibacteria bacterium]
MVKRAATVAPAPGRKISPTKQAVIALFGCADRVRWFFEGLIAPHGITAQQYNVLRILRGAEPEGLPTLSIVTRMIERAPGITRMIDRLETKGLVTRERRDGDRRCIYCRITAAGNDLLGKLDAPVDAADQAAFAMLSKRELTDLIAMLERVRDARDVRPQELDRE